MKVAFPERLGTPASAKGSEFWAFFFEGDKVLAWEIHSVLRDKDFGDSGRGFAIKSGLGSNPSSAGLQVCGLGQVT